MAKRYDASHIESIDNDRERVQRQANIYIPDTRLAGALHLIREITDNAQDEVLNVGGGVTVTFNEQTQEITVDDNGRGIPLEKLQELCEVLNSSGKFTKNEDSAYGVSGGLYGFGMKLTNFLSEYFEITAKRDGKSVTRYYEDGLFIKEKKSDSDEHGTFVRFKLSSKYLKELDKIDCAKIRKLIEEKTDACPGLTTFFKGVTKKGEKVKEKFIGLTIDDLMKKYMKPTSKTWVFNYESKDESLVARIAFGYDSKAVDSSNLMGWTNFIYNKDGGTHVDALTDSVFEYFKKYMLNNFFSEKEKKDYQIRREDAKLGLCGVVVVLALKPEFHGQYKEKMISEPIYVELCEYLKKELNAFSEMDKKAISTIIRDNIKARLSSIRARQSVKKVGNGLSKDRIENYISPRMGCTTKFTELYLCEGLSASVQAEKSRHDFQAIYSLRGKVDNVYDHTIAELSKIPIVEELSRILGMIPGKKSNDILIDRVLGLTDADEQLRLPVQ